MARVLSILVVAAAALVSESAWAKGSGTGTTTVAGQLKRLAEEITELPRLLALESSSCKNAMEVLDKQDTVTFPEERLSALKDFRECLAIAKGIQARTRSTISNIDERRLAALESDRQYDAIEMRVDSLLKVAQAGTDFRGLSLAAGVGFSRNRTESIRAAEPAADGTVRVTERVKQDPRVLLVGHYFGFCRLESCREGRRGIGPFFGVAASGDDITSFALGLAYGMRDKTSDNSRGLVVGVGGVLDRKYRTLARGFEEGKPLPAGETEVKTETRSKWSLLLYVSQSF